MKRSKLTPTNKRRTDIIGTGYQLPDHMQGKGKWDNPFRVAGLWVLVVLAIYGLSSGYRWTTAEWRGYQQYKEWRLTHNEAGGYIDACGEEEPGMIGDDC